MSLLNRRQSFKTLLDGFLQTAGTVILASTVLPARVEATASQGPVTPGRDSRRDLEERARQVGGQESGSEDGGETFAFLNGGFANGGFRKGGFANGGFENGGFRKGGWVNGGWRN
jgi:hypothetical protein